MIVGCWEAPITPTIKFIKKEEKTKGKKKRRIQRERRSRTCTTFKKRSQIEPRSRKKKKRKKRYFEPREVMDGVLVGWDMLVDPDDDAIWVTNISDEEVLVMPGLKFGFLRNDLQLRAPKKRKSMKLLQYLRNQFTPRFGGNIFTVQEGELSPVQDKAASEVIQKMLQERVLEPAPHSNYRIPFFLVEKGKDKNDVMQYRLVLSAKKLNECFANINYAPPKIPHILAQLKGKTLFSTLDLSSSFRQLEIDERDRHILTIQHTGQLFRYRSLPQG